MNTSVLYRRWLLEMFFPIYIILAIRLLYDPCCVIGISWIVYYDDPMLSFDWVRIVGLFFGRGSRHVSEQK